MCTPTKAGLHSYSQSLRVQLKKTNVSVFELAPPGTQTPIMAAFDPNEFAFAPVMDVSKRVKQAIAGLAKDNYEIGPGLSKMLNRLGRVAPTTALAFFNKSLDAMLAEAK